MITAGPVTVVWIRRKPWILPAAAPTTASLLAGLAATRDADARTALARGCQR